MGIQEDCVWLRACYAESFTRSFKGSKQKGVKETGLVNTKADGLPSLHSLVGKKLVLRLCPKGLTLVYSMNIYNLNFILEVAIKMQFMLLKIWQDLSITDVLAVLALELKALQ